MPLKILLVNFRFLPDSVGGSEYYTYHLAKALLRRGYDVTVLTSVNKVHLKRFSVYHDYYEDIKVISIVNSHHFHSNLVDSFIEPRIDEIFKQTLKKERFELVHFQHLFCLSGRLPELCEQLNIPSILTLHDYWHMCFRSHLVRGEYGLCPGPSDGVFCASCPNPDPESPKAIPQYPKLMKILKFPPLWKILTIVKGRLSQASISTGKAWLFTKSTVKKQEPTNPHILSILEHKFRFDFLKKQLCFPKFVLSPSVHLKERYASQGFRAMQVLPLGFETVSQLPPLPFNGKLKIAYIGNFVRHKNPIHILKEFFTIKDQYPIECHFHGKAPIKEYFEEVRQLAEEFPKGTVKFFGGYNSHLDLKDILRHVHFVIFPSLWEENYPLVVRETLLHGIPVLASNLGGVPEVITDGVNGFLFDPYSPGDLSNKIVNIFKDPQQLERVTHGARTTKIEPMEDHIDKTCQLYAQAINSEMGC